jgi:transcriptional regulator with GAF, ATPase, and Fis domain
MSEPRDRFLGSSLAARRVRSWIDHAARVDATVLILGESGVGKEIVAREIHDRSQRASQPFVPVNCAAIPETLIESELFGHAAGAFTDARGARRGAFELADRGTLFLDEVGDLSSQAQPKLLRSLEAREIVPVGSESARPVDLRVIAATNHDLMAMTLAGAFRSDLYFRVRVLEIRVPPLRERPEDIPELAAHVLRLLDAGDPRGPLTIVPQAVRALQAYSWPGNVRELRNVIERAVILAASPHLTVQAPKPSVRAAATAQTLEALEIRHIRSVLESTNWRVRGRGGAAERLGLKPTTLESRMARLGITRKKAS